MKDHHHSISPEKDKSSDKNAHPGIKHEAVARWTAGPRPQTITEVR